MPRNIEIKARIEHVDAIRSRVAAIADKGPIEIAQDDTFFACPNGRLKLREFEDGRGELIYYERPDAHGPKESFYVRSPTSSPDTLREALTLAYGQAGRIRKHRTLFLVGRTRVHLDDVAGLGHFLELEVVLDDGEPAGPGVREAHGIVERLGVPTSHLVDRAYVDLLSD